MQITSSAIENIAFADDNQVTVTFKGGRDYLYNVSDLEGFQNDLNDVIEEGESVGRFVNRAIRAQLLQTVWTYERWVTQTLRELKLLTSKVDQ